MTNGLSVRALLGISDRAYEAAVDTVPGALMAPTGPGACAAGRSRCFPNRH